MVMEDQVVFVTGASQGAGAAITAELVERGHRVVASMRSPKRDGGQLEEAARREAARSDGRGAAWRAAAGHLVQN